MPRYADLPKFVPPPNWRTHQSWAHLADQVDHWVNDYGLDLNPDFQRGHVWTREQQIAFVEYKLQRGHGQDEIRFNCPGWSNGDRKNFVIVDGKQRLHAVLAFVTNKLPAFGYLCEEYEDRKAMLLTTDLMFSVNALESRTDVLTWYKQLNVTGTPHTKKELDKVDILLLLEQEQTGKPFITKDNEMALLAILKDVLELGDAPRSFLAYLFFYLPEAIRVRVAMNGVQDTRAAIGHWLTVHSTSQLIMDYNQTDWGGK